MMLIQQRYVRDGGAKWPFRCFYSCRHRRHQILQNAKTIFLNLLQALDCSAALVHHDHTPALVSLFNVCILHLYLYYYLYLHLYLHL